MLFRSLGHAKPWLGKRLRRSVPRGGGLLRRPTRGKPGYRRVLVVRKEVPRCYNPSGGWLGSSADEGRDKLRKATGRCMSALDPWIAEWDFLNLRVQSLMR